MRYRRQPAGRVLAPGKPRDLQREAEPGGLPPLIVGSPPGARAVRGLASRLRAELGSLVTVLDGDATNMALGTATFSAVACFTMLHHLPSSAAQDRLFAEVARVLVPGGVFAGTDSQPSWRFRLIHLADTCNPVDPGTLAARLAVAGFGQIKIDTSHGAVSFVAHAAAG